MNGFSEPNTGQPPTPNKPEVDSQSPGSALLGHPICRCSSPAYMPRRIGDARQPVPSVIGERRLIAQRVGHGGAVAARVVLVAGDVALRIGHRQHFAEAVVGVRRRGRPS